MSRGPLLTGPSRARCLQPLVALVAVSLWAIPSCDRPRHLIDSFPELIDPKEGCPVWLYLKRPPEECPPVDCKCWISPVPNLVYEFVSDPSDPEALANGSRASGGEVLRTNTILVQRTKTASRKDIQDIAHQLGAVVVGQWPEMRTYFMRLPTADIRAVAQVLQALRRDPRVELAAKEPPASTTD